jgi:hypothetical protein
VLATILLICEFQAGTIPATWSIWPVNRTQGWLSRVSGRLKEENYRIVLDEDASEQDATITAPDR